MCSVYHVERADEDEEIRAPPLIKVDIINTFGIQQTRMVYLHQFPL